MKGCAGVWPNAWRPDLNRLPPRHERFSPTTFEYFRNGLLDASDWFTAPFHVTKPNVHQNDFGGVLGGPIRLPGYDGRDKTFLFFSHEGLRLREPRVTTTDVPTLAIRQSAVASIAPNLVG